jgi:hypothetical protein
MGTAVDVQDLSSYKSRVLKVENGSDDRLTFRVSTRPKCSFAL